jgi:hypothetical protein
MPKELDFSEDRGVRFSQYFGERSFIDSPELEADNYARIHHAIAPQRNQAIARTTGSVQGVDPFPQ